MRLIINSPKHNTDGKTEVLFSVMLIDFQQDLMTDETEEWELSATGAHRHTRRPLCLLFSSLFIILKSVTNSSSMLLFWNPLYLPLIVQSPTDF